MLQVLEQEKYQLRRQLEVAEEEYQLRFLFHFNPDRSHSRTGTYCTNLTTF
jgi:hypothetical protein